MNQHQPATITSFVIRFVQQETEPCTYRGSIRHIPSNREISFTRWEDAVSFISEFIPLDTLSASTPDKNKPSDDR